MNHIPTPCYSNITSAEYRQRTLNLRSKGGFALVELLTVLVIIAILVAIAVTIYNSTQQTARDRADEANVRILNSATLQWMLENKDNDPRNISGEDLEDIIIDRFVKEWPKSPNSNKDYDLDEDKGYWVVVEVGG